MRNKNFLYIGVVKVFWKFDLLGLLLTVTVKNDQKLEQFENNNQKGKYKKKYILFKYYYFIYYIFSVKIRIGIKNRIF